MMNKHTLVCLRVGQNVLATLLGIAAHLALRQEAAYLGDLKNER